MFENRGEAFRGELAVRGLYDGRGHILFSFLQIQLKFACETDTQKCADVRCTYVPGLTALPLFEPQPLCVAAR